MCEEFIRYATNMINFFAKHKDDTDIILPLGSKSRAEIHVIQHVQSWLRTEE